MDTADAPYFVDLVRTQLAQRYEPKDLSTQNLAIQTSLDLQLQGLAQKAVENGLDAVMKLIKRKDGKLPAGLPHRPRAGDGQRSWPWSAAAPTGRASTTA